MKIPVIFQEKLCNCGKKIENKEISEVGVLINKEKFIIRFVCSKCNFKGKITFSTSESNFISLCEKIIKENKKEESIEQIKKNQFDKNKIGCWHIPDWTDESYDELIRSIDALESLPYDP